MTQLVIEGAKEFEKQQDALLVAATPIELLRIAVTQNADLDRLQKLMDMQERWERNEARKLFVDAMSKFKAESIVILKDKVNKQYDSKYVSLGNLVSTVTPYLSKHGLSARWDINQKDGINVSCIITHAAGHSESVSISFPPDKSGSKNPIQEIKSAITYAKACTFESACGLASTDANVDDDGNGASATNGELAEQVEWIKNACNIDELKRLYKNAYEKFEANPTALKQIIKAKKDRLAEIQ